MLHKNIIYNSGTYITSGLAAFSDSLKSFTWHRGVGCAFWFGFGGFG